MIGHREWEAQGTMKYRLMAFVVVLAGIAAPAASQDRAGDQVHPATFEALIRCRTVTEPAARLQCFDAAAAALAQATDRRDIVIVDRAQIRESRRRLFGLTLPSLPIFGRNDNSHDRDDEEIASLEGSVASATRNDLGQWQVTLQQGGTWIQTDFELLAVAPRRGQPIVIRRGTLGSYMMRVANQPGVRVRRVS